MRWILLLLFSITAFATSTKPIVDKIEKMIWDGKDYTITFINFPKKVVISGSNQVVPCLENAVKSEMEVLITIDSDIPMVKSCKLYSSSAPVRIPSKQAQEEKLSK